MPSDRVPTVERRFLQGVLVWLCAGVLLGCSGYQDVDSASDEPSDGKAGADATGSAGQGEAGRGGASGDDAGSDDGGEDVDDDDGGRSDASVDASVPSGICTVCGSCETAYAVRQANHVVGEVDYKYRPPVGGNHNECWGRWGVHDTPLADERWVHNEEHGGVIFLYNCPDGCSDEVAALENLVAGKPFALLTPYPDMSARFAVVSWGHRLVSDCFDEAAMRAFYDAHADRAPESVTSEPPAGCPP